MISSFNLEYWLSQVKSLSIQIDNAINRYKEAERQEMSQAIITLLRDFDEAVAVCITEKTAVHDFDTRYKFIEVALKFINGKQKYQCLDRFHVDLRISISHYSPEGEYSERLVLKYIQYLVKIKWLLKNEFHIDVLNNINKYPLDLDDTFENYYVEILKQLSSISFGSDSLSGADSYYVQKKKMIYCHGVIFYEYTITNAYDSVNKFDRFVAFSKLDVFGNYAIKAKFLKQRVNLFEEKVDVMFLLNYEIAIRPCELNKISEVINLNCNFSRTIEYQYLMSYIKERELSIDKILLFDKNRYSDFAGFVFNNGKETYLFQLFSHARELLQSLGTGKNVLLYLFHTLNNTIISNQISLSANEKVSDLKLKSGVLPFDRTPFGASLIRHNPKMSTLMDCFDASKHSCELLKRDVSNNSIRQSLLYTSLDGFSEEELKDSIEQYNRKIPNERCGSKLCQFGKYVYLEENEQNTHQLLKLIIDKSKQSSFPGYLAYAQSRIFELQLDFDDKEKEKAVQNVFNESNVFAVYGPAGTGKTTFANYVLKVLGDKIHALCLANTNPALQNLRNRIEDKNARYSTIYQCIKDNLNSYNCDVLIVDECSNVSTKDMLKVLNKVSYKLVLFLGDIYQIEAIQFGNWYSLLRYFLKKGRFVDLDREFRSHNNPFLPKVWKKVRELDDSIDETLNEYKIPSNLNKTIFEKKKDDEIILCLNYDGLYGINNINKYLQENNENKPIIWKQYTFKIGDPILFVENSRFGNVLYNNLKGTILGVEQDDNKIYFSILIDKSINPLTETCYGFELTENCGDGKSIIKFDVSKFKPADYDNDTQPNYQIPFQIAYAVSIHKSQGLEYDSVKIIITNEVEEQISHNIFYTAITRAKEDLTIYWTPETEKRIIASLKKKNSKRDAEILATRFSDLKLFN